ncbi:MAG: CASTOR/POLLUX-related putative ion channel, partial [Archangium sp.]
VVRTGDPRNEQALLRVAAQHARAVIVMPPANLPDEDSVQWTLSTLLAMHRIAEEGFRGRVIVEARRTEARELLSLAGERDLAGPGMLSLDIVASDDVVASILAQSTRQAGIYFVLRHLLAFDGCEFYLDALPPELVGRSFDEAHAAVVDAIAVGVQTAAGKTLLCPMPDELERLQLGDQLIVISSGKHRWRTGGTLPAPLLPTAGSIPDPVPQNVCVVGYNQTLPHLLRELEAGLPEGSRVKVVAGESSEQASRVVEHERGHARRIHLECDPRPAAQLTHRGKHEMCSADAVVILGHENPQDENGDASALAMLLRLRHGMKVSGNRAKRVVTEVRDPRSAMHIVPRREDCVVSSDVVAMLLAQSVLDSDVASVYRELLAPGGVTVHLRPRRVHLPDGASATFADVMVNARARGEVALGFYPDPRSRGLEREIARQRLEEGDVGGSEDAWLNPPRDTPVPEDPDTQVVVLAHGR